MKKVVKLWIAIASILMLLQGCRTKGMTPSAEAGVSAIAGLCSLRETGELHAGARVRVRAMYRFVSRHEEYLIDPNCSKGGIDVVGFVNDEESTSRFLSQRDSECRRRGQADFCVIRANIDATVEVVDVGNGQHMMRMLQIHQVDWLPE